jgi:hypothetical protein
MGKLISGIFGMDSGVKQAQAGIAAGKEYAKDVTFKPVTIASTLAAMTGSPEGEYSGVMQPQLLGISSAGLEGAQQMLQTVADFDPNSVTRQLFQQQLEQLQPELRAQQIQLGQNVFKTGRGGLGVSGAAVGAPTGTGLVNPDAYGLMAAQTGVLGQLQTQARQQAFEEARQTGQLGAGLMGTVMGIEDMAQKLIALGIDAQSARSAASAAAGQIGTGGYNMATQAAMNQDSAMGSFWGGLFGGAGAAYGGYKAGKN